jgi:hypothetical protein
MFVAERTGEFQSVGEYMKGADVISYRFSKDSGRSKEYYSKSYDWAPESDLQVTPVRSRQQRGDVFFCARPYSGSSLPCSR